MNPIFYILIPLFIATFFIGIHWILEVNSWQRELKRDEEKRKLVDMLLEVDPEDWEVKDFPVKSNA